MAIWDLLGRWSFSKEYIKEKTHQFGKSYVNIESILHKWSYKELNEFWVQYSELGVSNTVWVILKGQRLWSWSAWQSLEDQSDSPYFRLCPVPCSPGPLCSSHLPVTESLYYLFWWNNSFWHIQIFSKFSMNIFLRDGNTISSVLLCYMAFLC